MKFSSHRYYSQSTVNSNKQRCTFPLTLTQDIGSLALSGAEGGSQGAAVSSQPIQNALISLGSGGLWLVVIDVWAGGQ